MKRANKLCLSLTLRVNLISTRDELLFFACFLIYKAEERITNAEETELTRLHDLQSHHSPINQRLFLVR